LSERTSFALLGLLSLSIPLFTLCLQLYGQSSPWNLGFAYRVPDTNLNLQGQYQQGKTNVQVSCVADEYASMLGPNGFTNGVGPGNLGLSLNLNM